MQQLCEDILVYRRDMIELRKIEKESRMKREQEDKKKGEEMRQAAVERIASEYPVQYYFVQTSIGYGNEIHKDCNSFCIVFLLLFYTVFTQFSGSSSFTWWCMMCCD